jgi:hypothetical protein
MSSAMEGMMGSFSIGGTAVALLTNVSLDYSRPLKEMAYMGQTATSDVLQGVRKYKGAAKHAYVDNTFLTVFIAGTELVGTLYPRGGTTPYVAGTIVIGGGKLSGIDAESESAVMEDIDFVMYNITKS